MVAEPLVIVAQSSGDAIIPTAAGQGKAIRHGEPFEIRVDTGWQPIAPLFSLFGAETFARKLYAGTGGILKDVRGDGFFTIVLKMEANDFSFTRDVLGRLWSILREIIDFVGVTIHAALSALTGIVTAIAWAPWIIGLLAVAALALGVWLILDTRRQSKEVTKRVKRVSVGPAGGAAELK